MMKYALPAAFAATLFLAMPAQATQGLLCRPAGSERPRLSLVLGAGGIAGANLDENGRWISAGAPGSPLFLSQAWIDRDQVLADLVDARWEPVARLRVRFLPLRPRQPQQAAGTLTVRGQVIRVRCQEA